MRNFGEILSVAILDHRRALDQLCEKYLDCEHGNSAVILVSGESADDKTRLLREFTAYAANSGALCLASADLSVEHTLEGGIIDQLMHNEAVSVSLADRVRRLLAGDGCATDATMNDMSLRRRGVRVAWEMCIALRELSESSPVVVIAVDDIQFVESLSRSILVRLCYRIRARVMIVLAAWCWEDPDLISIRGELTREPDRLIVLTAPSSNGADDRNPAASRPRAAVDAVYAQVLLHCLARWDSDVLEVARAVAILREHATVALISRLVGRETSSVERALTALTATGLLAGQRLCHPVIEAAAMDGLTRGERSLIHSTAAHLLHQHGAAAGEIAQHLLVADSVPGRWAVRALRDAAEQALVDDEPERAPRFLELALTACATDSDRDEISRVLARITWRISPSTAALHLESLRARRNASSFSQSDAVALARQAIWAGDYELAQSALTALREVGTADSHVTTELRAGV
jgi:hypothetical protein